MTDRDQRRRRWLGEFRAFLSAKEESPPPGILAGLMATVRADLGPPLSRVVSRLVAIHALVAAATLLFCPQLGIGPLVPALDLMAVFMTLGPVGCAWGCGLVFLGVSHAIALLCLPRAELRRAATLGWRPISALAAVSLAVLILLGGSASPSFYLHWLMAGLVGGWLSLKAVAWLRLGPTPEPGPIP